MSTIVYPFRDERSDSPTVIDGKYKVLSASGKGGMGLCFRVLQLSLERPCVLKMLPPSLHPKFNDRLGYPPELDGRKLLENEAMVLGRLSAKVGEGFVQIHDRGHVTIALKLFGERHELELPYYVMELLHGRTLEAFLLGFERNALEVPIPIVLDLGFQAARALDQAHALRIIHRDIKPDNVWVEMRPGKPLGVKWIDFGVSTLEGQKTERGTGTNRYGAPELLSRSCSTETTKSDIYPLGLVLYEMAALRGPFGSDPSQCAYDHVWERPPPLSQFRPDAPPELIQLVAACLEKKPENRPSAAQVAERLGYLRHGLGARALDDLKNISRLLALSSSASGHGLFASMQRDPSGRRPAPTAARRAATVPPSESQEPPLPIASELYARAPARPQLPDRIIGQPVILIGSASPPPPEPRRPSAPPPYERPPRPTLRGPWLDRSFRSTAEMFEQLAVHAERLAPPNPPPTAPQPACTPPAAVVPLQPEKGPSLQERLNRYSFPQIALCALTFAAVTGISTGYSVAKLQSYIQKRRPVLQHVTLRGAFTEQPPPPNTVPPALSAPPASSGAKAPPAPAPRRSAPARPPARPAGSSARPKPDAGANPWGDLWERDSPAPSASSRPQPPFEPDMSLLERTLKP